jgi:NADH-quinone oxidoreductase subunit J
MVLFLFVMMLLGSEKDQEEVNGLPWQTPVALVMGLVLVGIAGYALFFTGPLASVPQTTIDIGAPDILARKLFSTYLLPFEITSVLLLLALIGAVVLTMKSREGDRA